MPMPVLTILTDEGQLCLYLINNFQPNAECVCAKFDVNVNLQHFTSDNGPAQVGQPSPVPQTPPNTQISIAPAPQMSIPTSQFGFANNPAQVPSTGIAYDQAAFNASKYRQVDHRNVLLSFGTNNVILRFELCG